MVTKQNSIELLDRLRDGSLFSSFFFPLGDEIKLKKETKKNEKRKNAI